MGRGRKFAAARPSASIQPLVENAVRHGVLARSRGGTVTIRIKDRDDFALIEVEDDGGGMDEAATKRVLDQNPGGRSGIGLCNTDRRLKQLSGNCLHIRSYPGQGTTISFVVSK